MNLHSESLNSLFYELIRVAIGNQNCLSRQLLGKEWNALYNMAQKQSLVGVCFAALQKLGADADEGFARIGMSEMLYLTWMGMAAKIQQKNQTVDKQCVALQKRLSADGFQSCILKGQGVGQLYAKHLLGLRQSGDIDVWVDADEEKILRWAWMYQTELDFDYKHVHIDVFDDTTVEVHYRPLISRVPWRMTVVECFSKEYACWDNCIKLGGGEVNVPSQEFNLVFILQHIYGHLFAEEMTLKQYLDYYFVLQKAHESGANMQEAYRWMERIGMGRFAQAAMWLLHKIFGLEKEKMLCAMDEKEGQFLLDRVMAKEHKDKKGKHGSIRWHLSVFKEQQCKNLHLLTHYPLDVMFSPFWLIRHFCWKRMWKMGHKELFYSK